MRALVIIEADSWTDFDAAIQRVKGERVSVFVLDENWDFPEHENLTQKVST